MGKLKITMDKCSNYKSLKKLEKHGLIEIYDVEIEQESAKIKNKIKPIAFYGKHVKYGKAIYANEESRNLHKKIKKIIGSKNIRDALILEAHIRNKFDYFVTEDKDFLNNRKVLETEFGVCIVTSDELLHIANKK